MNTKKALNIIIILLLVINLVMTGFILYLGVRNSEKQNEAAYGEKILEYRGIQVNVPLDGTVTEKKQLQFSGGIFTETFIEEAIKKTGGVVIASPNQTELSYFKISTEIPEDYISDRFDADTRIREFLDSISFNHINYVIDTVTMSSRNTFTIGYIYQNNNETLYDLSIKAVINEYGIKSINLCYIENDYIEGKNFKTLSMTNIIMSNIVYDETKSNIITRVDAGYKKDLNNVVQYVYRITFADDSVQYFNAQNGQEIK